MTKPALIVYHKNCIDGRLSFAVASKWHKIRKAKFEGMPSYPGEEISSHNKYGDIYFLDLVPTEKQYHELAISHNVFVIDHHKTNEVNLTVRNTRVLFDISKCGCVLAWEFFFPGKDLPIILEYAQDYDLWKFSKPKTHNINLALSSLRDDDNRWDEYLYETATFPHFIGDGITKLNLLGEIIKDFRDKQVEKIVKTAKFTTQDDGTPFAVVYSQCFRNMIAEAINKDSSNNVEYVVILSGGGKVSFRSNSYDVSGIAESMGGGGHKTSAGALNIAAYNEYLEILKEVEAC